MTKPQAMALLLIVALVALLGFALASIVGLLMGLLLFSVLKGAYRPYLSGIMAQSVPDPEWKARWFSIVGVGTAMVSAVLNAVAAFIATSTPGISTVWMVFVVALGVPVVVLLRTGVFRAV